MDVAERGYMGNGKSGERSRQPIVGVEMTERTGMARRKEFENELLSHSKGFALAHGVPQKS